MSASCVAPQSGFDIISSALSPQLSYVLTSHLSIGRFIERHSMYVWIVGYKHRHTWWHSSPIMCTNRMSCPQKAASHSDLNKSHELPELNSNCHQTKSSLSFWKKGVFWGTLEWILLPRRETNWARQASLREWLKLVCGSASAPPNKEEKPLRERERMRENESKKEPD